MADTSKTPKDLRGSDPLRQFLTSQGPSSWITFNPINMAAIEAIENVKSTIVPVIDAVRTILELIKSLVETVLSFLTDITDIAAAAVKAAIDAVRAVITDLLDIGSFHGILIPVARTDLETTQSFLLDATLGGLTFPNVPPETAEELAGSGGNNGFMNLVAESLSDELDPNRPQYDADAHIAAAVIVLGAPTDYEILKLLDKLSRALKIPGFTSSFTPLPRPQGLRASVVASQRGSNFFGDANYVGEPDSAHPYGVKLDWDLEKSKVISVEERLTAAGTVTVTKSISGVVIWRAEHPTVLKPSMSAVTLAKIGEEIGSFEFDGFTSSFYDNTIELDTQYSYAVGYLVTIEEQVTAPLVEGGATEDEPTVVAQDVFSVVTADISTTNLTLPATKGVPPDWVRVNLLDMLAPGIRPWVERNIIKFLDVLEETTEGSVEQIKKYVDFLEAQLEYYSNVAEEVVSTVEEIIDVLTWPAVYSGVTLIYSSPDTFKKGIGGGGNQLFLSQLSQALTDQNDPNRPPFDRGTEAVCGIILMAGSETYGGIAKTIDFFETLFGQTQSRLSSAFKQAADSIDYLTDRIRDELCMSPALEAIVCPATEEEKPALDPALQPATESAECTSTPGES